MAAVSCRIREALPVSMYGGPGKLAEGERLPPSAQCGNFLLHFELEFVPRQIDDGAFGVFELD